MGSRKPFNMAIKKDKIKKSKKRPSINLWRRSYMMCPSVVQCIPFDATFIGKIYLEHICLKISGAAPYLIIGSYAGGLKG